MSATLAWVLVNWMALFLWITIAFFGGLDAARAFIACPWHTTRLWRLSGFITAEALGLLATVGQLFDPKEQAIDPIQALTTYMIVFTLFALWRGCKETEEGDGC